MLLGTYYYQMDVKDRVPIPAKLRMKMGKKVIVARGFEEGLIVHQVEEFEKLIKKLKKLPFEKEENRHLLRLISASAEEVEIDNQGRIRIPSVLKQSASLEKGKVIILGVLDHLEIWNPQIWQDFKEKQKIIDIAKQVPSLANQRPLLK